MEDEVGPYRIRRRIGRGGMASVYLAERVGDRGFRRLVALKRVHPHLADDRRFVGMLFDEASLAARMRHPNVCPVLDFGESPEGPYLVMDYLHGVSLKELLGETGALPAWVAARVVADAARGIQAIHALVDDAGRPLDAIHRDVSPHNIILTFDGHPRVVDLGVARARGRITETRTGEIRGKLGYMSPEQIRGERLDARTDVWALGVVLRELCTGRRLFHSDEGDESATMYAVLQEPIPALDPAKVPAAVAKVIGAALQRDRASRIGSAEKLASSLETWLYERGQPAGAADVAAWVEHEAPQLRARRDAALELEAELPAVPTLIESTTASAGASEASEPSVHRAAPLAQERGTVTVTVGTSRSSVASSDAVDAPTVDEDLPDLLSSSDWQTTTDEDPRLLQIVERARQDPSTTPGRTRATSLLLAAAMGLLAFSLGWWLRPAGDSSGGREPALVAEAPGRQAGLGEPERAGSRGEPVPQGASSAGTHEAASSGMHAGTHEAGTHEAGSPEAASPGMHEAGSAGTHEAETDEAAPAGVPGVPETNAIDPAGSVGSQEAIAAETAMRRARPGQLNLVATPAARVYDRGQLLGSTPLVGRSLPAGIRTLTLRPVGGGPARRLRVTLRAGETLRRGVRLEDLPLAP